MIILKSRNWSWYTFTALVLFVLIATGGVLESYWAGRIQESESRSSHFGRTATAATSIDPSLLAKLTASDADLANPAYVHLKEQLARFRSVSNEIRFYYLMRKAGNNVVFLCDSEPPESEDYSPPGQLYDEAPSAFMKALTEGVPGVVGPYTDRWGVWVTSVVPICDGDGHVVAALASDIDAQQWKRAIISAQLWPVVIALLLAVLLALTYVTQWASWKARLALRESERKYRTIFENASIGIFRATPDDTPPDVNPALALMLGFDSAAEVKSNTGNILDLYVHPEDRALIGGHLAKKGLLRDFELELLRKDGRRIWVRMNANATNDPSGRVLCHEGFVEDITDRKRAEQALRESQNRLQAIIQGCPIPQFVIDRNHRVYSWNRVLEAYSGIRSEEVLGTNQQWRAFYAEPRPCLADLLMDGRIDELPKWYEGGCKPSKWLKDAYEGDIFFSHMVQGGRWLHYTAASIRDAQGNAVGAVETLEDITDRKHAEEALRRQVEFDALVTRLLARFASCASSEIDEHIQTSLAETGTLLDVDDVSVILVSPTTATWSLAYEWRVPHAPDLLSTYHDVPAGAFPWTERYLEEREVLQIDRIDDLPPEAAPERQRYEIEGVKSIIDIPFRSSSGPAKGCIAARSYGRERCWTPEEIQQFHMIGDTIVTALERKHTEADRAHLAEQLVQSQKMESVGRLAGGVAHDFNNMLVVILGYSELLQQSLPADSPCCTFLTEIMTAGERAKNLTRQLLAFSRKQVLEMRVLDLDEVVREMEKMLQRLLGEDVRVELHTGAGGAYVKADPSQMEQILLNLCINARDAMADGGILAIETGVIYLDEHYASIHPGVRPGPYAMLSVSDTGCGMDENTRLRAFDPFFTTKEKGKGTGLGLATVFGIVKQHGGDISVYSEPNHGTTFKVYLPQVQEAVRPGSRDVDDTPIRGHGETILVIEDETAVRRLACQMLLRLGYNIIEAQNPEECLDHMRSSEQIDLLLTDVIMPEMNGRQLQKHVLAIRPGMKTLFMSGYTENAIAHHGVLDTGIHFLAKPFTENTLSRKVWETLIQ